MAENKQLKRNSEYWVKRFDAIEERRYSADIKFSGEVEKVYKRTLKEVDKDIAKWYSRLQANNGDISLTQARKLLSGQELEEFKLDLDGYIALAEKNKLDGRWVKELENASARIHISRLEQIRLQIRQHFENQFQIESQMTFDHLVDRYGVQYYQAAFEIQKGVGFGVALQGVDSVKLEKLLMKPWTSDNRTFSDRIFVKKEQFINSLYQELTQAVARGKGPEEVVRALYKDLSSTNSRYEIRRVVITESVYFSSEAQKTVFRDLDVERYEILATLDSRTSQICQNFDGQIYPIQDFQSGTTAPPFHPFCRTVTIPYIEGDRGLRYARDRDGKAIKIPADLKYKDWYEKFIK